MSAHPWLTEAFRHWVNLALSWNVLGPSGEKGGWLNRLNRLKARSLKGPRDPSLLAPCLPALPARTHMTGKRLGPKKLVFAGTSGPEIGASLARAYFSILFEPFRCIKSWYLYRKHPLYSHERRCPVDQCFKLANCGLDPTTCLKRTISCGLESPFLVCKSCY